MGMCKIICLVKFIFVLIMTMYHNVIFCGIDPNETTVMLMGRNLLTFPDSIVKLTALEHLDLSENQIVEIPVEIGKLTALEELDLSNNQIVEIPVEIGKLTALEYLYLSNNQIVEIPVEIEKLTALKRLYLNNNQIVEIPVEIGKLKALTSLDLSENNISCVPMDFAQKLYDAGNLRFFDLRNNPLNEYGEGVNNLGWRDLKNMFGDRIIIDQDTQNVHSQRVQMDEDGVYESIKSKGNGIYLNFEKVSSIKPYFQINIDEDKKYDLKDTLNKWEFIRKSVGQEGADYDIVKYIKYLYTGEEFEGVVWPFPKNDATSVKIIKEIVDNSINDIYKFFVKNSQEKSTSLEYFNTMFCLLCEIYKSCPTGQLERARYLHAFMSQDDYKDENHDAQYIIEMIISRLKENVFDIVTIPPQGSQNVHVSQYWRKKLHAKLGLNILDEKYTCQFGTLDQDPFKNHMPSVLYAFFSKFTPNYLVEQVCNFINQDQKYQNIISAYIMTLLKNIDYEKKNEFFSFKTDEDRIYMIPCKIKQNGIQAVLVDMHFLIQS